MGRVRPPPNQVTPPDAAGAPVPRLEAARTSPLRSASEALCEGGAGEFHQRWAALETLRAD